MEFEWDQEKRIANLFRRGIDLEGAKWIFSSFTSEESDDREDYGEDRWKAIGIANGTEVVVVYADVRLGDKIIRR